MMDNLQSQGRRKRSWLCSQSLILAGLLPTHRTLSLLMPPTLTAGRLRPLLHRPKQGTAGWWRGLRGWPLCIGTSPEGTAKARTYGRTTPERSLSPSSSLLPSPPAETASPGWDLAQGTDLPTMAGKEKRRGQQGRHETHSSLTPLCPLQSPTKSLPGLPCPTKPDPSLSVPVPPGCALSRCQDPHRGRFRVEAASGSRGHRSPRIAYRRSK